MALRPLILALAHPHIWPAVYVRFEAGLLQELGFGLDLSRCAATGSTDDLIYVSPRTGRAVSRSAGEPYKDKMLKLPPFLLGAQAGLSDGDVDLGLVLTGHFLELVRVLAPEPAVAAGPGVAGGPASRQRQALASSPGPAGRRRAGHRPSMARGCNSRRTGPA